MIRALTEAAIGAAIILAVAFVFLTASVPHAQAASCGKASWYGVGHQGKLMANGKPFNRHAMTAASWHYPLGTRVIVRNVQNGRSVQVTITDRGPAKRLGRIIDLSESAFAKLAPTGQGIIKSACVARLN